jgi:hypothetical protein
MSLKKGLKISFVLLSLGSVYLGITSIVLEALVTGSNMPQRILGPQRTMRPVALGLLAVAAALACSAANAGSGFGSAAPRRAFPRRDSQPAAEPADEFGKHSLLSERSDRCARLRMTVLRF